MHTLKFDHRSLAFLIAVLPLLGFCIPSVDAASLDMMPEKYYIDSLYPAGSVAMLSPTDHYLTKEDAIAVLSEYTRFDAKQEYMSEHPKQTVVPMDIAPGEKIYPVVATLCDRQILMCSVDKPLLKNQPITLPAFLKLFFLMTVDDQTIQEWQTKSHMSANWYEPYMQEAKKRGYIGPNREVGTEFTQRQLFYILYRDTLLKEYKGDLVSYFPGLVRSSDMIDVSQYVLLEQLEPILRGYTVAIESISKSALGTTDTVRRQELVVLLGKLQEFKALYKKRYDEIALHPLWYDPLYSTEQKELFKKYGIDEEIGQGTYDFHTSAAYRKKNIWAALSKVHQEIIQPGEEFDYWKILQRKGLGGIGNGWIISGGKEIWAWGGGLCGSATVLFRAAWNSGMEITDRAPHSIYYVGMYKKSDVGLDAMVAQGGSNLKFKNVTSSPLMVFIHYSDASRGTAIVRLLGKKHVEQVILKELTREAGQYVRTRILHFLDGTQKEEKIYSSYRKFM